MRRFWPWYAVTLAGVWVGMQVAQAHRAPQSVHGKPTAVASAVMAIPPKPEGVGRADEGDTAGRVYTLEGCLAMPPSLSEGCLVALAWQRAVRDPEGALDACNEVEAEERRMECAADVAELHAPTDRVAARKLCPRIPAQRWRDQCVFGIAMALVNEDPLYAVATCEDAGMWTRFCRHDVNGTRAQVDTPAALSYCASLPPLERVTCVHGIGKYVGRVDVGAGIRACGHVPLEGDLRGQCMHGLGWAAAEQQGAAAVGVCEPLEDGRDGCILGVAYHTKRVDVDGAVVLCNRAHHPDERTRCLEMVGRTVTVGAAAPTR